MQSTLIPTLNVGLKADIYLVKKGSIGIATMLKNSLNIISFNELLMRLSKFASVCLSQTRA